MSEQEQQTSDQERQTIREAMSIIGRSRSPRKLDALAENRAKVSTDESRRKQSEAQKARRQKEREALGVAGTAPVEKRPPGRPRKQPEAGSVADCDTAPKRGRGRPRKELTQMTDTNG